MSHAGQRPEKSGPVGWRSEAAAWGLGRCSEEGGAEAALGPPGLRATAITASNMRCHGRPSLGSALWARTHPG